MIKKIRIKNFNSIKDTGDIEFSRNIFVLAGQNESGKTSVLEAMKTFEKEDFNIDTLNFEEQQNENLKQEVSISYEVDNQSYFIDSLRNSLRDNFSIDEEDVFLDIKKLEKIKSYLITKIYDHKNETLSIFVNDTVLGILKSSILEKEVEKTDEEGNIKMIKEKKIDIDENKEIISKIFWEISPKIILFDTFSDLLPDKISITDIESKNTKAKGYNAVKSLEKLLNKDFVSISKLSATQKKSRTDKEKVNLSNKFKDAWKQRIHDDGKLEIVFWIESENVEGVIVDYIYFALETKNNVTLEPRKRSKGMIWFLSAWLELKSKEDLKNLVILFDEPGLYLHIKAHSDILGLFNDLVRKGHQVIYSTHSPSLINVEKLDNIGLVLNDERYGTIVEELTTSKINTQYKRDALQPISEAMGLEPLKEFSIIQEKNVLLEGLSDFWYFSAMAKILDKKIDYKFVPGIGVRGTHIYPLISFCIGYGLNWLLVMDNGHNPKEVKKDLAEKLFCGDISLIETKAYLINEDEIENMFTISDFKLVDGKIKGSASKKPIDFVKSKKVIFSKIFFKKVDKGEIKKEDLSKKSITNFEKVFEWIESNL